MLKWLLFPLQWLWRSWFFVNAVLTFFIFLPLFTILLSSRKWFPKVFVLKKIWAHFILFPAFIFYFIRREEKLDRNKTYVFCPNHTSYLDIMLIYIAIPNYFHTIGKAELMKVPLFNRFFKRMNIPVNRKSHIDSHKAFVRAGDDIDKGISITLFPEGTIHHTYPQMGRFKNGPFKLAIEKQVPIVPITFLNNNLLLPDNYWKHIGRPGVAGVVMHKPIETRGMTENDLDLLKQKCFDVIDKTLKEYAKERGIEQMNDEL
jgi:1-acyl-sn-glycerol-3-phosphate acyltransferase